MRGGSLPVESSPGARPGLTSTMSNPASLPVAAMMQSDECVSVRVEGGGHALCAPAMHSRMRCASRYDRPPAKVIGRVQSSTNGKAVYTFHRSASCGSNRGITGVYVERHVEWTLAVRVCVHQRLLHHPACRHARAKANITIVGATC
jgi:hypothetical protein